jgi:hypothetical protein
VWSEGVPLAERRESAVLRWSWEVQWKQTRRFKRIPELRAEAMSAWSALRVGKGRGCDWKLVGKTPHLTRSSKGDPEEQGANRSFQSWE